MLQTEERKQGDQFCPCSVKVQESIQRRELAKKTQRDKESRQEYWEARHAAKGEVVKEKAFRVGRKKKMTCIG